MLVRRCPWRSVQLHQFWRPRQIHTREAIYDKRWPDWEVVIGIEVHAQIKSRRKLFSGASFESINYVLTQLNMDRVIHISSG